MVERRIERKCRHDIDSLVLEWKRIAASISSPLSSAGNKLPRKKALNYKITLSFNFSSSVLDLCDSLDSKMARSVQHCNQFGIKNTK